MKREKIGGATFVTDGHLGGYIEGGDPCTYQPGLWAWLRETLPVRSVLDVGCGEGHALRWFRDQGCRVLGVDGIPQDDPDIVEHDYAAGPWPGTDPVCDPPWDLVWCCEFVEHVEERHLSNVLATFRCATWIALTHAVPGQGGYHHVNCRTGDYWVGALAAAGYETHPERTQEARRRAASDTPCSYFARTGIVARRLPT